ncbi:MAG: NADH-quinone oxidoreductase subunit J [Pyrinomonadaceae bacterium]|nr:NADH-quinone oxidoreductase subunit J [Pyrinomonadaceae bacterium]
MITSIFFIILAGAAIGCAIAVVAQRNPLYSAISLIGVFISLSCLYVLLAAPFIAAVQVIVYAGAIMVLVVFVIMLLNVEEEVRRPVRLHFLIPTAVALAAVLIAEVAFLIYSVEASPFSPLSPVGTAADSNVGLTSSIGTGLFTKYLLPFEITSVLILMAIVGAITLARRIAVPPGAGVIPSSSVLTMERVDPRRIGDATETKSDTTTEAARVLDLNKVTPSRAGD